MDNFRIIKYRDEGRDPGRPWRACARKEGVKGDFYLGSYCTEEALQKLAGLRLQKLIDNPPSEFTRWQNSKIEISTEVKNLLQKTYDFIHRGACLHSNEERVELQEKIKSMLT